MSVDYTKPAIPVVRTGDVNADLAQQAVRERIEALTRALAEAEARIAALEAQ